ncbi:MAG: pyrroline-5-carboxylate reductase [Clostridiales bacterium]|nr:pyrroline-5-carboxylate reductase [Clostridiales bacterium]MCF8021337.1 pyrroline-5-carboxylate reductase [Clostridiales bacterium]
MVITQKIGFLGGGAMAEALMSGIVNSNLILPETIYVSDLQDDRLVHLKEKLDINIIRDNTDLVHHVDIVILAVKPFILPEVLKEVGSKLQPGQLLVSIAAGIPTSFIENFVNEVPVVRVMPNTPCLVREGAVAIARGKNACDEHSRIVEKLCSSVGMAVSVKESLMDAVTGLSGSGPAYMYLIVEALADAGVRMGLPRDTAIKMGAQTMLGAARMIIETGEHPSQLKDKVTTPGGTTIEGVFALEDANVRAAFMEAVEAACIRSRELSGN